MRLARYDTVSPTKQQRGLFCCGEPSLDRWFATQAGQRMKSRDAVTYLLLDDGNGDRIVGYYCLSAGSVSMEAAPAAIARRAPRPIPVVRMGRFAIDSDYQNRGWGAELLREALLSAVSGADVIGARALLVDAISDRAASFYRRYGFVESPTHPLQLFKSLQQIKASAGFPWPT